MKQTLILVPGNDSKFPTFVGADKTDDGIQMFMTAEPFEIHLNELPPNKKLFKYTFTKHNTQMKIEWDWDKLKNIPGGHLVIEKQQRVKDFLMNHRLIETEGHNNRRLVKADFCLRIVEDIEQKTYEMNRLFLNVQNLVNEMSLSQQKDLIYFFGGNPAEFNQQQVWLDLIGHSTGRLLNENNANVFLKSIKPEQQRENSMRVCIKKAILWGIITTRDNKYWSGNNDLLGVSEDFVYQYYVGHPDLYAYLKKEVNKKEGIEEKEEPKVDVLVTADAELSADSLPESLQEHIQPFVSKSNKHTKK